MTQDSTYTIFVFQNSNKWKTELPNNLENTAQLSVSCVNNIRAAPLHLGIFSLSILDNKTSTDTHQVWELLLSQQGKRTHLTEEGKLVIRKKPIGLIQEKISTDEFFESPVFPLHKPICPLTLWSEKKKKLYLGLLKKRSNQIHNLSMYKAAGCENRVKQR